MILALFYAGRVWNLQVIKGASYQSLGENNILHDTPIFSERGVVSDRNGILLAWNAPNPADPDFALRHYFASPGLSHILGYVKYPSKDSSGFYYSENYVGKDGIERFYNDALTGKNGQKIIETDAFGKVRSQNVIEPAQAGQSLALSIDSNLVAKMYSE